MDPHEGEPFADEESNDFRQSSDAVDGDRPHHLTGDGASPGYTFFFFRSKTNVGFQLDVFEIDASLIFVAASCSFRSADLIA